MAVCKQRRPLLFVLSPTIAVAWFLVSATLGGDQPLTEEQRQTLRRVDENGGPFTGPPELSWQSDYDRPELTEYLRIKHSQP
jgi:hypothetical protein